MKNVHGLKFEITALVFWVVLIYVHMSLRYCNSLIDASQCLDEEKK